MEAEMIERPYLQRALIMPAATVAIFMMSFGAADAATTFTAVAAGDMSANDAILWTRTIDPGTGAPSAADGIRCDADGNIWAGARPGVQVISPGGERIGAFTGP